MNNFEKMLVTCKKSMDWLNNQVAVPRRCVVIKSTVFEIIALSKSSESESIGGENRLFKLLKFSKTDFSDLVLLR